MYDRTIEFIDSDDEGLDQVMEVTKESVKFLNDHSSLSCEGSTLQ